MIDIDENESLRNKFLQTGDLLIKSGVGSNSKWTQKKKVKKKQKKYNEEKSEKNTSKSIWTILKILGGVLVILFILSIIYNIFFATNI